MRIKVLGPGCANCKRLEERTREAVASLGLDAEIGGRETCGLRTSSDDA